MPINIEVFENGQPLGSFDFEACPRIGETLQVQGKVGSWRVVDVRHVAVKGSPAQLQIAIQLVSSA